MAEPGGLCDVLPSCACAPGVAAGSGGVFSAAHHGPGSREQRMWSPGIPGVMRHGFVLMATLDENSKAPPTTLENCACCFFTQITKGGMDLKTNFITYILSN